MSAEGTPAVASPLAGRGLRGRQVAALAVLLLAIGVAVATYAGRGRIAAAWRDHGLPRGERPDVLLITLDGVRADFLGAYGRNPSRTPNLDRLGREGVLAERQYTSVPLCLPAHATLLTGRRPRGHGARDDMGTMRTDVPTLAEVLHAAGWAAAAFVSSTALDGRTGLGRGFDPYDDDLGLPGKRPGSVERARARETVDRALAWLEGRDAATPSLVWVHLDDARPPRAGGEGTEASYAAAVGEVDAQVGRLVERARKRRPSTLVVVAADHGDALGAHGEDTFGFFVYGSTTRVPFLVHMPGRVPQGVRLQPATGNVDVLPTVLDLVGVAAPATDGASLVPLMVGRSSEGPGPVAIENVSLSSKYGFSPLYALRSGPYLYVRAPRAELYDSGSDPEEQEDASGRLGSVASRLDAELRRLYAGEDLAVGGGDPKDELEAYNRYRAAGELEQRGSRAQAIDVYRSLLSDHPGFVFARRRLSETLMREGRFPEAEIELKALIAAGQATDTTYLNLALVRFRDKHPDEALDWLRKGLQAFPSSAALRHRAGRLLLQLQRPAEALPELERAVALEPRFLDARVALGLALEAGGRKPEARAAFDEVSRLAAPDSDEKREAAAGLERTRR